MSGKRADSVGSSSFVTSALREAAFAGTIYDRLRYGLRLSAGSTEERIRPRSWSMKPPPTCTSFFKANTGQGPIHGTTSCTARFVRTCVPLLRVSRESPKDLPQTSFFEESCRQARGETLKQCEIDTQIMLSSSRYIRSWWETFRVVGRGPSFTTPPAPGRRRRTSCASCSWGW
jgi:hypothetical protein